MGLTTSRLAIILSKLRVFDDPKFIDEQYTVDSEIGATILWNAFMSGDIQGRKIADLGAGTGLLGIGASLLEAKEVFFVERDTNVTPILHANLQEAAKNMQNCITHVLLDDVKNFGQPVDTVIQNPPFGVKKMHADRIFLEKAFEIAHVVYSFHKSESTDFLKKFAEQHNFSLVSEQKFAFPLKRTMKFHTSRIKCIDVSCYVFRKK